MEGCLSEADMATYTGPTGAEPGKEPLFEDPKPKWYSCAFAANTKTN